jgi:hypothetical protein
MLAGSHDLSLAIESEVRGPPPVGAFTSVYLFGQKVAKDPQIFSSVLAASADLTEVSFKVRFPDAQDLTTVSG